MNLKWLWYLHSFPGIYIPWFFLIDTKILRKDAWHHNNKLPLKQFHEQQTVVSSTQKVDRVENWVHIFFPCSPSRSQEILLLWVVRDNIIVSGRIWMSVRVRRRTEWYWKKDYRLCTRTTFIDLNFICVWQDWLTVVNVKLWQSTWAYAVVSLGIHSGFLFGHKSYSICFIGIHVFHCVSGLNSFQIKLTNL